MSRRQLLRGGILVVIGGILCYLFPLFHVRRLGDTAEGNAGDSANRPGHADAASYVRQFWDGPLRRGEGATEVTQLWAAWDADRTKANRDYGRQVGLGGAWYFCVHGQGRIESIDRDRCSVALSATSRRVCIELGVIVDNTVRDAIGVNVNEFANSQEFNAVSAELNRRVEQDVIAPNRPLFTPGDAVTFIGCAKIDGKSDIDPLCIVPIRIDVAGTEASP